MKRDRLKKVFYTMIAILSLFVVVNLAAKRDDFSILKTSVVHVLQNIIEENIPEDPDLRIASVSLKKVADPTYELNYYRYQATVVIENLGGQLLNSTVKLSAGKDQEYVYVRNTDRGFLLGSNEKYIVDNYEVVLDGKYNGGEITFNIDVKAKKQKDINPDNNNYSVSIFEQSAKLEDIEIANILEDNTFVLDFEPAYFYLTEDNFEIYTSDSLKVPDNELKYAELNTEKINYGYFKIKNSEKYLKDPSFKKQNTDFANSKFIKYETSPFEDEVTHYAFITAKDPLSGNYVFSNILVFPRQEKLNRAQFSKLFVDIAGIEIMSGGKIMFDDIKKSDWYTPYVQTLYSLGLIDSVTEHKFDPGKIMTRGEALRVVMDYFDGDLKIPDNAHFKDVPQDEIIFPYAEGFYAEGKGRGLSEYFNPDRPVTGTFLKYLIYEYRKNS